MQGACSGLFRALRRLQLDIFRLVASLQARGGTTNHSALLGTKMRGCYIDGQGRGATVTTAATTSSCHSCCYHYYYLSLLLF